MNQSGIGVQSSLDKINPFNFTTTSTPSVSSFGLTSIAASATKPTAASNLFADFDQFPTSNLIPDSLSTSASSGIDWGLAPTPLNSVKTSSPTLPSSDLWQ